MAAKRMKIYLLLFEFLFLSTQLFPQHGDLTFEHITVDDGLPENSVRTILQDHLGFMWFGTQNGLVKYDGYEMTIYRPDPTDTSSFTGRNIYSLYEDKEGNIWIGTELAGLSKFDRATETFTQFKTPQFDSKTYDTLESLQKEQQIISSILKVGNNEDRTELFQLAEETTILIIGMGEGSHKKLWDYGWIENDKADKVWKMDPAKTVWAGGNYKNKIQIASETFPPGKYLLHYKSNSNHGYQAWSRGAPGHPEMWGIQLLELSNTMVPEDAFERTYVNTIQSNWVTAIAGGQQPNVLWIATYGGGLSRLDISNLSFRHYQHDPDDSTTIPSDYLNDIHVDQGGNIWIAADRGLIKFIPQKEEFTLYQPKYGKEDLRFNEFYALCEDRSGTLWIGAPKGGVFTFDKGSETFKNYRHNPNIPNSLSSNDVLSICEDQSGSIWIAALFGGLDIYDRERDNFRSYTSNFKNPNSLSNDRPICIFEDRTGVLWVGTHKGGLNKIDRGKQRFRRYLQNPDNPNSLSDNEVYSIYEDQSGIIWIGTHNHGLTKFIPQSIQGVEEKFRHYQHDPADPNSLSDNAVTSIFEDRQGMLWIGTWEGGLNRFDKEKNLFKRYQHNPGDPQSLGNNQVMAIYEDHLGVLWIGTYYGGLNRYNSATETFTRFPVGKDNQILKIYEDHFEQLWVGTNGDGLQQFDREKEIFTAYGLDEFQYVLDINEDNAGNLWIGTGGRGLYLFDREGNTFINFNAKQGLINDNVRRILNDKNGNLWISTEKGISKFNPLKKLFKNFANIDGLLAPYNVGAFKSRSTGEMFFGGQKGLTVFHPDSIKDNPYPPSVAISELKLFDEHLEIGATLPLKEAISIAKQIRLAYWQNDISFGFAALHFNNPQKNEYAYFLKNYEDDWRFVGNQRVASYTNLNPGEYIFHVKASNNDGVWNEEGASLKIIILPPWWKTWWAYALYTILIGGTLYGLRRYELGRQRLKHNLELERMEAEKFQEIDRTKSRFFANISHEFRTPLTLICGPVQRMLSGEFNGNVKEQFELILRNTRRLLRLVNQLLDVSRLESGKMKLQARPENIVVLTRQLTMAFESLAIVNNIQLQFTSPEGPLTVYLDREHYEKIISNLLFNALKFTPAGGKVSVDVSLRGGMARVISTMQSRIHAKEEIASPDKPRVRKDSNNIGFVQVRVTDTGAGIPAEHVPHIFDRFYQAGDSYVKDSQGSGIGLALTKELVELNYGQIQVSSVVGKGTEFTIRLPLGKEHLKPEEIVESKPPEGYRDSEVLDSQIIKVPEEREDSLVSKPSGGSKTTPTLLIVEDNIDMRTFIREILVESYGVVEAEDGKQGFEKAVEIIPDIIISDVMMPEMDGFQFCEKIKTDIRTSHIPVILLTAKSSSESKVEGLETGADDYLTKPFDARELQVRVKNLIEQRERLRRRFQEQVLIQPADVTVTSVDSRFLKRAIEFVEAHIDDAELDVKQFSKEMALSRSQLNRKLRALTKQSVTEFVRCVRLKRAAQLLEHNSGNISEIAYTVGFGNPAYFAECFRKQFGVSPSKYASIKNTPNLPS